MKCDEKSGKVHYLVNTSIRIIFLYLKNDID